MRVIVLFTLLVLNVMGVMAQDLFSYKTENARVTMLSDMQREIGDDILVGVTDGMRREVSYDGEFANSVCSFLVQPNAGRARTILIDTGYGNSLVSNLYKLKIKPKVVDAILLTHLHPDHIGGLFNKDGEKNFPRAILYLSKKEYDSASAQVAEMLSKYYVITFNAPEETPKEIVGGVKAIACYGHTAGHTVYVVDNVVVWGDVAHSMLFQMPFPNVTTTYDVDGEQARASRTKLMKFITENDYIVAGMHIPYPGMGCLKSNGDGGYDFTPLE